MVTERPDARSTCSQEARSEAEDGEGKSFLGRARNARQRRRRNLKYRRCWEAIGDVAEPDPEPVGQVTPSEKEVGLPIDLQGDVAEFRNAAI
jgi:hypothetical protein